LERLNLFEVLLLFPGGFDGDWLELIVGPDEVAFPDIAEAAFPEAL
jgi:hypothetical protein